MTMTEKQSTQQAELHKKLWKMVNDLRGNMEASQFKDYILGILFYRFLSDKLEAYANELLENDDNSFATAWTDEETREGLIGEMLDDLGFVIEPDHLFSNLVRMIEVEKFDIELFEKAINSLTESTIGQTSQEAFDGLFDDMNLQSTRLGKEIKNRSKLISKILLTIDSINFGHDEFVIDVLGDAYEYLISMFASTAGKLAGEFFTAVEPSRLLTQLASVGLSEVKRAYDPTSGSGSLLLRVGDEVEVGQFYGQEKASVTANLCRMNMLLHDIPYDRFHIRNADTIEDDKFEDIKFGIQVANPPYSVNWSGDERFLEDERFSAYGKLAPKSKGDFTFVQHMVHHMDEDGRIAVLLPHGVLFRGGAEGVIRKYLIEELNVLDAIIGLPANLFYGTSIPVSVLVLKKNRENNKDNILFIDASKEFESGKNQNKLREEDLYRIVNTYKERIGVEKYAHVATIDEIKENDFNLNIPRYVDTFEEEEVIDIKAVQDEIASINLNIEEIEVELAGYFHQLGL